MSRDLPRWVFVVRQDKRELYENLRQGFEGDGRVEVILDRRSVARREKHRPVVSERRRTSRRRGLTLEQTALWEGAGFRMLHRGEGYDVYQAETPTTGRALEAEPLTERDERLRAILRTALTSLGSRKGRREEELRRLLETALQVLA
ncbi:MAG: hypothetical protein ACREMB_11585 [Candidatus Rokuibacteriota bacterium]